MTDTEFHFTNNGVKFISTWSCGSQKLQRQLVYTKNGRVFRSQRVGICILSFSSWSSKLTTERSKTTVVL